MKLECNIIKKKVRQNKIHSQEPLKTNSQHEKEKAGTKIKI